MLHYTAPHLTQSCFAPHIPVFPAQRVRWETGTLIVFALEFVFTWELNDHVLGYTPLFFLLQFIYHHLDSSYVLPTRYEEEIPKLLKNVMYPVQMTKSSFVTGMLHQSFDIVIIFHIIIITTSAGSWQGHGGECNKPCGHSWLIKGKRLHTNTSFLCAAWAMLLVVAL